MLYFKTLAAAGLLACSLTVQAAPPPAPAQPGIPLLLTSLGTVLNPILQPVLSISGPIVGGLVANATPQIFALLGGLGSGPINGLLGRGGLVDRLPTLVGTRRAANPLPPLPGLQ